MSANPGPPAQTSTGRPSTRNTAAQRPRVESVLEPNRYNMSIRLGRDDYRLLRLRLDRERRIVEFYRTWKGRLARVWEEYQGVAWTLSITFFIASVTWWTRSLTVESGVSDALSPWLTTCILRNSDQGINPSCTLLREDFIQLRNATNSLILLEDYSTYVKDLVIEAREAAPDISQMADIGDFRSNFHFDRNLTRNESLWTSYEELSDECRGVVGNPQVHRDDLRSDFAVVQQNLQNLHHWLRDVVQLQGRKALSAAIEAARSACWLQERRSPVDVRGWEYTLRCWGHDMLKRRVSSWVPWITSIQDRRQRVRDFASLMMEAERAATNYTLASATLLADNRVSATAFLHGAHRASDGTDQSDGRADHADCFFFIDRIKNGARLIKHTSPIPYPGNDRARALAALQAAVQLYTRQAVAFDSWIAEAHRRGRALPDAYLAADHSGMMPRWYTDILERDQRDERSRKHREEARGRLTSQLDMPAATEWLGPSTYVWHSARRRSSDYQEWEE